MNKNTILYYDSLLGYITIQDFIHHLDYLLKINDKNQDTLRSILENSTELDACDIASLVNQFDFEYDFNFIKEIFEKLD